MILEDFKEPLEDLIKRLCDLWDANEEITPELEELLEEISGLVQISKSPT